MSKKLVATLCLFAAVAIPCASASTFQVRVPGTHMTWTPSKKDLNPATTVNKAKDNLHHARDQVNAELHRDLKKLSAKRQSAVRAAGKAVADIVDAAKAAQQFETQTALDQARSINEGLHRKDIGSALWLIATSPAKNANKNAMAAMQESKLLAVTVNVAATFYGGPAGAAAYAAWIAYNSSGGNMTCALRVGVTQGVISAATGALANMPAGTPKELATFAAKKAIAKLQGAPSEDARQALLGVLISNVPTAEMDTVQRALVTGALGGASVAAAGGDHKMIKDAFFDSGGNVLIQGLKEEAKEEATKNVPYVVTSAIPEAGWAKQSFDEAKASVIPTVQQATKAVTDGTNAYAAATKEAQDAQKNMLATVEDTSTAASLQLVLVAGDVDSAAALAGETASIVSWDPKGVLKKGGPGVLLTFADKGSKVAKALNENGVEISGINAP